MLSASQLLRLIGGAPFFQELLDVLFQRSLTHGRYEGGLSLKSQKFDHCALFLLHVH
jgi:hypothetical protein